MAVRKFKPITPGTRHKIIAAYDEITTSTPEKSLLQAKKTQMKFLKNRKEKFE